MDDNNLYGVDMSWLQSAGCQPDITSQTCHVHFSSLRKVLSAISSIAEVNLGDLIPCTVEATTQRGVIAHTGYYKLKVTCENEYIQGNKEHLKQGDAIQARVSDNNRAWCTSGRMPQHYGTSITLSF